MQTAPRRLTGVRPGGPTEPLSGLLSPGERIKENERPEGPTQGRFSQQIAKGCIGPPGLTASSTLLPVAGALGSDCIGTPCLASSIIDAAKLTK